MIVCDTPEKIAAFRLLALRGALALEIKGLKRRGQSASAIIKRGFNLKGNKQSVANQFEAILRELGILV
jgi:hypothetical protein